MKAANKKSNPKKKVASAPRKARVSKLVARKKAVGAHSRKKPADKSAMESLMDKIGIALEPIGFLPGAITLPGRIKRRR